MQNYEMLLKQTVCPIFKTDTSSDIIDTDILENKILLYICQLQHVFVWFRTICAYNSIIPVHSLLINGSDFRLYMLSDAF